MNALRYLLIISLITGCLLLQACGNGGGGSDTMGVLTLTAPTVTGGAKIGDIATVAFTVTYTPPAGKVANGTIISTNIVDGNGNIISSYSTQLYSNISYSDAFYVPATATEQFYSIHLSIGSMTAGSGVVIPAGV